MVKTRHQGDSYLESFDDFESLKQPRRTRRSCDAKTTVPLNGYASDDSSDTDAEERTTQRKRRGRPSASSRRSLYDENGAGDASAKYSAMNGDDGNIRRSQRNHKLQYSTLNQSLIDKHVEFNNEDREYVVSRTNSPRSSQQPIRRISEEQECIREPRTSPRRRQTRSCGNCKEDSNEHSDDDSSRKRRTTRNHHVNNQQTDDDEDDQDYDHDKDIKSRPRRRRTRSHHSEDEEEAPVRQHQSRRAVQTRRTVDDDDDDESDRYPRRGLRRRRHDSELDAEEDTPAPAEHPAKKRCRDMSYLNPDYDDGQDMYTRVKRVRKQVKRDMYGVPINDETDKNSDDDEDEQSDTSDDGDGSDEEENEEEEELPRTRTRRRTSTKTEAARGRRSYSLREHRPQTTLYIAPAHEPRPRSRNIFHETTPPPRQRRQHLEEPTYQSPARRKTSFKGRRKHRPTLHGHSSTSSSGDSEGGDSADDEDRFEKRKAKSMAKARNRLMPMNFTKDDIQAGVVRDRMRIGSSMADVDPMSVDRSVTFEQVGGLGKHVTKLKEMVVFPLLYPEVFERFKIAPPRGCLFYGPPGTGKTLVARALANECSTGERKVAFFMRKGADCLSKWVGESERQLRLLFDQAYQVRPSIIFFDEIDGLAPVRSSRQDQIHSSIVSTLLALMDGLDNRGEIVVIGATNRIDSIDPALRRPGRFDREFHFPLPSLSARSQILTIHTREWQPRLHARFLTELAEKCVGYCGADLRALCTEAALNALRRRYPQIYTSADKLQLDVTSIQVSARDFHNAMKSIVPTTQRSECSPGRSLSDIVRPLLEPVQTVLMATVCKIFPPAAIHCNAQDQDQVELYSDDDDNAPSIFEPCSKTGRQKKHQNEDMRPFMNFSSASNVGGARMLICSQPCQGASSHLAPAILHALERLPVHTLDLPALYSNSSRSPEESCAGLFREARRTAPSLLYVPHFAQWWDVASDSLRATFLTLLADAQASTSLMFLATADMPSHRVPSDVQCLFDASLGEVFNMTNPSEEQRRLFFTDLFLNQVKSAPSLRRKAAAAILEELPKAAPVEPRGLSASELKRLQKEEESTMRELRLFLRDAINKLGRDKKFGIFAKPVDADDVPDYGEVITNPMDLSKMMSKIDLHKYQTVSEFMEDIELIVCNALEYNPDTDPQGRAIRHRACALRDTAQAIITNELDPDFEKLCDEIVEARKRRGQSPSKDIPKYYYTKPVSETIGQSLEEPERRRFETESTHNNGEGVPKLRQVWKRVSIKRNKASSANMAKRSPWCRPSHRRYKRVLVWVDEFGHEVNMDSTDDEDAEEESTQNNDNQAEADKEKTAEMEIDNKTEDGESNKGEEEEMTPKLQRRTRSCLELNNTGLNDTSTPRSRSADTSLAKASRSADPSPTNPCRRADPSPTKASRSADPSPTKPASIFNRKSPRSSQTDNSISITTVDSNPTSEPQSPSPAKPESTEPEGTTSRTRRHSQPTPGSNKEDSMVVSEADKTLDSPNTDKSNTNIPETDSTKTSQQDEHTNNVSESERGVRVTRSAVSSTCRQAALVALHATECQVEVDLDKLRNLLALVVDNTQGHDLQGLLRLHAQLHAVVQAHRHNYNKQQLTQELEDVVVSCVKH